MALHVNKLEFSSPKNTLCQVWLIMAQWFWEVDENMKGLRRRQRTGKSWSGKLSWAFGSGELKGTRLFPIFKELVIFLKGGGGFSGTNKDNLSFDVAYWSTYVNTNDCLCGRSEQLYGSCFSGTSNWSFCLECDRPDQLGWRIIEIWVFKVSEEQHRLKVSETTRKLFNHCRFICNICWKRKLNVSLPELSDDFFPPLCSMW